ncbi:MAG TPA: carbonic anhydrase [Patescibacteria group bacterium]|nr:carbonic anhydrase [Patescibacteria group bacterium]
MAHSYPALLINCMDPRLGGKNAEAIAKAAGFGAGQYEQLAYPGPSLWLEDPHHVHDSDLLWWTIDNVSLPIHRIHSVVLVGHSNCGGFKLKGAPQEPVAEKQAIVASLKRASQALAKRYPELHIFPIFVQILAEGINNHLPKIVCEKIAV